MEVKCNCSLNPARKEISRGPSTKKGKKTLHKISNLNIKPYKIKVLLQNVSEVCFCIYKNLKWINFVKNYVYMWYIIMIL